LALRSTAGTGEQVRVTTGPRWEVGPGQAREEAGTTVARLGASDLTKGGTVKGRRVGLAAVIRTARATLGDHQRNLLEDLAARTLLDRASEQVQLRSSRHELPCGLRGAGKLVEAMLL